MISTALAQTLPSTTAPQQAASAPALSPRDAARTVEVPAGAQAITVELKQAEKTGGWTDPTAIIPALAIVGTLVATLLQLHYGRKNLDKQLRAARDTAAEQMKEARADAQQEREHARVKEIEGRLAQERTKVFTELIESLKKALMVIGALSTKNPAKDKEMGNPVADLTASVNKVWLFAGTETVLQTRELLAMTMETFLDGMIECMSIYRNFHGLDRIDETIARLLETKREAANTLLEFRRNDTAGLLHTPQWKRREQELIQEVDRASDGVGEGRKHRQEVLNENAILVKRYAAWLAPRQIALMNALNDVLKQARIELHVPGDMASIDLQTVEMLLRFQKGIAKVFAL